MRRGAFVELVIPGAAQSGADRARLAGELEPLFGRDLADHPSIVLKQVRAMARFSAEARLPALAPIPTLVVSAARDRIAPPLYGRPLAARIPGARYVEIPDAGHGVTIQRAHRINELLAAHWTATQSAAVRPPVVQP